MSQTPQEIYTGLQMSSGSFHAEQKHSLYVLHAALTFVKVPFPHCAARISISPINNLITIITGPEFSFMIIIIVRAKGSD